MSLKVSRSIDSVPRYRVKRWWRQAATAPRGCAGYDLIEKCEPRDPDSWGRVSYMTPATTTPETNVSAPTAVIANGRVNASAMSPAAIAFTLPFAITAVGALTFVSG